MQLHRFELNRSDCRLFRYITEKQKQTNLENELLKLEKKILLFFFSMSSIRTTKQSYAANINMHN